MVSFGRSPTGVGKTVRTAFRSEAGQVGGQVIAQELNRLKEVYKISIKILKIMTKIT